MTLVKKPRSSGLANTILQGTVKGKRRRGRQKKRREDNIKEWMGKDFASSTMAAENWTRWKEIVAISSTLQGYVIEITLVKNLRTSSPMKGMLN